MNHYFVQTYTWNPWRNLAVEKYLADKIEPGDVVLYLWQNDHTVVIGRNQNAIRECKAQLLEEEGGFLARRTTGGGAVYHDLGNLNFTFLASPERYDLEKQLKVIQSACRKFGIETQFSGRNDIITQDGFKFSGNAFSKNSHCNIQHGTLMVDVDVSQLGRYLTPSKEKMKAKGVKSVQSRVCNLKDVEPRDYHRCAAGGPEGKLCGGLWRFCGAGSGYFRKWGSAGDLQPLFLLGLEIRKIPRVRDLLQQALRLGRGGGVAAPEKYAYGGDQDLFRYAGRGIPGEAGEAVTGETV